MHDTIIFPEGGGQPSDVGYISRGLGTTLEVFEAKRVGGHAVHSVRFPTTDEFNAESATTPLYWYQRYCDPWRWRLPRHLDHVNNITAWLPRFLHPFLFR